jgi:beta-lactamase regulating signal transducer with metallopeptidase domain
MDYALFTPGMVVWALNIAVAAIGLSLIGLLVAKMPRLIGQPLQHGMLCVVVVLMLFSPAPIWLANQCGLGLITIVSPSTGMTSEFDFMVEDPAQQAGDLELAVPVSSALTTDIKVVDNQGSVNAGQSEDGPEISVVPWQVDTSLEVDWTDYYDDITLFQIVGSLVILIWGSIAFWCTILVCRRVYFVLRIQRSLAHPSSNPRLIYAAQQAFAAAGFDSSANARALKNVFESSLVPAPLTLGWWKMSVVLPYGLADVLNDQQLTCTLAHEVAHMVRRDTIVALMQQIAAAVFWWNPLLRIVNRQISQVRERLCDDCVVVRHGSGLPLAESIVQVAEWSATRKPLSGLSLALLDGFNDLEYRVHRLTEESRTIAIRLSRKSSAIFGVCSLLLGMLLLLPIVRATELNVNDESLLTEIETSEDQTASNAEPPADPTQAEQVAASSETTTAPISVSGRVCQEDGSPVAGATVYLVSTNAVQAPLGDTKTDVNGHYRFDAAALPLKKLVWNQPASGTFQVFAEADGLAIAWHGMRFYTPEPRPEDAPKHPGDCSFYLDEPIVMPLTMRKPKSLTGHITDEKGKPVAKAEICLSSLDYLDTEKHEMHHSYREFRAMSAAPEKYYFAQTNDQGQFEFKGLPSETVVALHINHPGFADQLEWAAITDKPITKYRYIESGIQSFRDDQPISTPMWATRSVLTSPLDLRVASTRRIVVSVVQGEHKLAVQNARVNASSVIKSNSTWAGGMTDQRGRVELKLPPGTYQLITDPPRETNWVRTTSKLNVNSDSPEQAIEVPIQNGCVLILATVDATSGEPIPDVDFWENVPDGPRKGKNGVYSSTRVGGQPRTNAQGEVRVVVPAGERHFGVGHAPLPDGYQYNQNWMTGNLVNCEAGKTIRVQFKLTK